MVLGAHFQEDRPQSSILKAGQRRILVPPTEQKRVAFRSPLSLVCANDGDSSSDAYALEVGGNKGWNVTLPFCVCEHFFRFDRVDRFLAYSLHAVTFRKNKSQGNYFYVLCYGMYFVVR